MKLTDIRMVNRLFVSAFLRHHNMVPKVNHLLVETYITDKSKDYDLLKELMFQLDKYECKYTLEDLTKLFEFVISPKERKVTGAVYTPNYIRERIIKELLVNYEGDIEDIRIADIACGCGGFFLTSAIYLHTRTGKSFQTIIQKNIYGIDIQEYSIERTKLLLSLLALMAGEDVELQFNLWKGDTLCFNFSKMDRIDVVVGNPPYVCARNMSNESRELLKLWRVCACGNSDLYIPFFQIAIELVREGGYIGYITMNSFLSSLNARALREYFHEKSYHIRIVDFRGTQIFKGKNTYTCLFFLQKKQTSQLLYCINEKEELASQFKYTSFQYAQLNNKSGWKLNDFKQTKIQETVGIPLGKFCQSRHGIATLSNKTYIFTPIDNYDNFITFEKEKQKIKVEKAICRRIINSNKLNADVDIVDIMEYVIFPYRCNKQGIMEIIPETEMKSRYPYAYKYLLSCRDVLAKRDKGKTERYPTWYAYGRTQSLQMPRYKLFFPKIANKPLHCELVDDEDLLLYNGMAFVSHDKSIVMLLKVILESELFWKYVTSNSKPYASGYYSLNGVNIKNFGIPTFTEKEISLLLEFTDSTDIDSWLLNFYSNCSQI